nr:hypothetical protein [Halostagnicola sp. A56]
MVVISNFFLVVAGLVVALRWIGIFVLTVTMPLLGVLWALEVWPFTPAANMARRAAGIYPGLILAGIPAALLFRIGWEVGGIQTLGQNELFALFIGLTLIPAAVLAMVMTVYWSSPAVRTIAQNSVTAANPASAAAGARKAKAASGKTVRGARNVHRGYANGKFGPMTKDGQTKLGGGNSKAYKLGESANSTKSHARQYNNLRKSDTGRMRDKAKADAKQVTRKTSTKAKQDMRVKVPITDELETEAKGRMDSPDFRGERDNNVAAIDAWRGKMVEIAAERELFPIYEEYYDWSEYEGYEYDYTIENEFQQHRIEIKARDTVRLFAKGMFSDDADLPVRMRDGELHADRYLMAIIHERDYIEFVGLATREQVERADWANWTEYPSKEIPRHELQQLPSPAA